MVRLLLMVLPLCLLACSNESTGPESPTPVRAATSGERAVLRANTDFGFTLFRTTAAVATDENLFLSPLSVSMALGMTANGAAGETAQAMRLALAQQGLSSTEINQSYRSLIDLLRGTDPRVRFNIANGIWNRAGFVPEQAFIDSNRFYFDADVRTLDFSRADAADIINAWVSQKTQGKIPAIVAPPIPPLTVMYLINAMYFKGTWATQFDPARTRDDVFKAPGDRDIPVKMMNGNADIRYLKDQLAEVVDLPYGWDRYSMAILLPRPDVTLATLRDALRPAQWQTWQEAMHETAMDLQIPRFTMEYETSLNDILASMGMGIAFDPSHADFSGISRQMELFISQVKHKTFVQVNEEGTEAAAATSVEIGTTSVPQVFRVDRPFVFVIHERNTGAILFIGQVTAPRE
ncbi:MAG: serpin family protein [Bacteroidota bacterium]|jgi:serpin B|nr:serpin family protein [Bacteroidota bacterium]